MKKWLLLLTLMLTFTGIGQTIPTNSRLRITKNVEDNAATRIVVQDSTKELQWILKSSLFSSAKYKTLPLDFNFSSIPVGYDNAIWIIRHDFNLGGSTLTLPANVTLSFEGGSITNGSIVLNNTTIDYKNIESVLYDVVLTGTVTNDSLDVRLFGILPNDNEINATELYNTNLVNLDATLFFPKGNYYFSELHVTKNNFQIRGEESNDLEVRTVFHPFNASQYYILKLGGGKFTLNDTTLAFVKNSTIMHIWFTTPLGFTGLNLTSPDAPITNLAYKCSALILDQAQGGRFAINGHTLHNMPLLSIGNAYELYFDYIKMHGNHGKSDLPIIQITNNFQAGQYISATTIHQLWADIMVGPVFAMSGFGGINELQINNVFIEGTIEWDNESIFTENRFTRLTKSLPSYYATATNVIPMFAIGGVATITIGDMTINGTDTEWQNSLDTVPLGWNTRSFFKYNTISSDIKIGSVTDGAWSQNMLLTGGATIVGRNTLRIESSSPEIAYYNQVEDNFDFIAPTNNASPVKLKSNYEYFNDDLSFLLEAKFLTNIGLDNHFITPNEPNYNKAIQTRWGNYILNQSGFYVDGDVLDLVGKTLAGSNIVDIEYYDVNNALLSTQNYSTSVTSNVLFKNSILLTKPVGYSYLKLVNANTGFLLTVYSLKNRAGDLDISITPATSAGTFEVLTRNPTTKAVEKKSSDYFQTALTNPVTGSGTINTLPKSNGNGTQSNSQVTDNGSQVSITTNSTSPSLVLKNNAPWNDSNYPLKVEGYTLLNGVRVNGFDGQRAFMLRSGYSTQFGIATESNIPITFTINANSEVMRMSTGLNLLIGTTSDTGGKLQVAGDVKAIKYVLSALNTAPSSSTDTGTTGEIRVTATYIYVCTATNTWARTALATW